MSKAAYRKVFGKNGSGRFVVSEGTAPATFSLASSALPTLSLDLEDNRFQIIINQGTILSAQADVDGNTVIVPANGTSSAMTYNDGSATPETITVPAYSTPIGAASQHALRPFDKGTSIPVSWIREAYVEWPMVLGLNDNLVPGSIIRSDSIGRPVLCSSAEASAHPQLVVGRVVETDGFATNFDDGLVSYMILPSDPGALREVYAQIQAGPYVGKLGVPANLDVVNAVGAIRATLNV